jgi:hypothetical protein
MVKEECIPFCRFLSPGVSSPLIERNRSRPSHSNVYWSSSWIFDGSKQGLSMSFYSGKHISSSSFFQNTQLMLLSTLQPVSVRRLRQMSSVHENIPNFESKTNNCAMRYFIYPSCISVPSTNSPRDKLANPISSQVITKQPIK